MYKDVWNATIGENLQCQRELSNRHDPFAVAVLKIKPLSGTLLERFQPSVHLFYNMGGGFDSLHCYWQEKLFQGPSTRWH